MVKVTTREEERERGGEREGGRGRSWCREGGSVREGGRGGGGRVKWEGE